MYFNTLEYFGFFALTLLCVRYSRKPGIILLLASAAFYVVAGWFDTALIAVLVASNWLLMRYVPLGGSKGSAMRQGSLLLLVMGVAGLWHGANTSFIVWGVLWGIYIGLHRIALASVTRSQLVVQSINNVFAKVCLCGVHLLIIVCLWVFFRAGNWALPGTNNGAVRPPQKFQQWYLR